MWVEEVSHETLVQKQHPRLSGETAPVERGSTSSKVGNGKMYKINNHILSDVYTI